MVADHVGKALQPLSPIEWHMIGRSALILFSFVIAFRLFEAPDRANNYLKRLMLWGLLAQPAFYIITGSYQLNVLFTFAAGVTVTLLLFPSQCEAGKSRLIVESSIIRYLLALGLFSAAGTLVEYGWLGVLLVPSAFLISRLHPILMPLCIGAVCLLSEYFLLGAAYFMHVLVACSVGVGIAYLSRFFTTELPRLPTVSFYLFYASHLYIICAFQYFSMAR